MNALTVNGKQLTLGNTHVSLNYINPSCVFFQSQSVLPAGTYKFIVNIPGAIEVKCKNLPTIGSDTILPIVNGVAMLTLTSDVNITNASIWPMYALDSNHYEMYEVYNSSSFELIHVNFGEILGYEESVVPLPPFTLRLRFTDVITPTNSKGTLTQVSASPNVWDWTYKDASWVQAWYNYNTLLEVIDGNTTNVTDMYEMFRGCTSLTSVPLFDTSNVTNMRSMFSNCSNLTTVPLFNTSNVTNMSYMLNGCTNVESGALALYQQASSQTTPPSYHTQAFRNCGRDTQTGAAELAQIPSSWK